MREHFVDNWVNFKDPEELVKHLDAYEAIKRPAKRIWNSKHPLESKTERIRTCNKARSEKKFPEKNLNWRWNKEREKVFEKGL